MHLFDFLKYHLRIKIKRISFQNLMEKVPSFYWKQRFKQQKTKISFLGYT